MAQGKPFPPRSIARKVVRLPICDWPALSQGLKQEFRMAGRWAQMHAAAYSPPEPAIGYAIYRESRPAAGDHPEVLSAMFLVENHWVEPLGAISESSLIHEGFEDMKAFKTYWRHDRRLLYKPLMKVAVIQLRPLKPEEWREQADRLMWRLYGEENWRP